MTDSRLTSMTDGIPSWARPGEKVVCVKAPTGFFGDPTNYSPYVVVPGAAYTIKDVGHVEDPSGGTRAAIWLVERPASCSYAPYLFRPLTSITESDTTEQSIFRKKGLHITAPKPETVE